MKRDSVETVKPFRKKASLGRGLDALLRNVHAEPHFSDERKETKESDGELRKLPIDLIQPGKYQPRTDMQNESLQDLADSIREQGVIQPIVVRPLDEKGRYEIIAGERRWRAAQLAELHEIPAIIRIVPDRAALAMALIENIQREDLNPIEEAVALQRLLDEFSMTHDQLAKTVGRSRTTVTNLLRLLSLNKQVRQMVEQGKIEMGHARALLALEGNKQERAANEVIAKQLSVRDIERMVRRLQTVSSSEKTMTTSMDPDIRKIQSDVSEKLGTKVVFNHSAKGKGKLMIYYSNVDQLEGILDHIK